MSPSEAPRQIGLLNLAVLVHLQNLPRVLPQKSPMKVPAPHYLLFSEVGDAEGSGGWRFLLRSIDGADQFEAADVEPECRGERLDLLTVIRALESLDQPSQVTLVGCSRYLLQGVRYGLSEWKSNGWRWEFFGQLVPVKNGDLWQRMDRALRFHRIACCRRRFDPPHGSLPGSQLPKRGQV